MDRNKSMITTTKIIQFSLVAAATSLSSSALAQTQIKSNDVWQFGAVLDVTAVSKPLALGQREKGLAMGHSDIVARGPVSKYFDAQLGAAVHQHDGKIQGEMEEAWMQSRSLPAGLQARVGRFASQIGYLNEQHPHADDFVERPLLYRSFLGGHWADDGLRLNWTAPTSMYLSFGAEVFRGRKLVQEAVTNPNPGAATLRFKLGDDVNASHSWQLGLSHLNNRREAMIEEEHGHEEHGHELHEAGHEGHDHAHGARLSGKNMWMVDFAWKWAPDGNNRQSQLRLLGEYAQVNKINRYASSNDKHTALALSAVWRFSQEWEVGVRGDWLKAQMPHGEHFHKANLREQSLMLAWKPSHTQTLRLQATTQNKAREFNDAVARSVQLQYVISFGAHGAHSY
jgi:hypothetical protein